jgi:RNA polymerase sigma-70 factor (ECF subfamily)
MTGGTPMVPSGSELPDPPGGGCVTRRRGWRYFSRVAPIRESETVRAGDGEVVRRVLAGEVEHYRVLVERYRQEFGRYAVAAVGDRDMADDALQEAFIRAYRSLATCRHPDRFGAWFFRILTNQCRNAVSRRRDGGGLDGVDPPGGDRADAALERGELGERLEAALARLTPEQREAFVMKHVEDRSYEEMAELLGVGVDALKMRVHRARNALRSLMGDLR